MNDLEITERLKRIERYTLLQAKNVLTIDDVALLANMSKSYLYQLTCKNQIPYYRPSGKLIYFDKSEVESWLKQNRVSTVKENDDMAESYCQKGDGK
jgi:excisionase family DNA binding protein